MNNFVFLANKGYFNCGIFHRVIPGFMDQTGDPTARRRADPGYTIPDEHPPKAANPADQYPLGRWPWPTRASPTPAAASSSSSPGPQGECLPNTYSLFGHVTSGMNVVSTINKQGSASGIPPDVTQRIISVTINES